MKELPTSHSTSQPAYLLAYLPFRLPKSSAYRGWPDTKKLNIERLRPVLLEDCHKQVHISNLEGIHFLSSMYTHAPNPYVARVS